MREGGRGEGECVCGRQKGRDGWQGGKGGEIGKLPLLQPSPLVQLGWPGPAWCYVTQCDIRCTTPATVDPSFAALLALQLSSQIYSCAPLF